MPQGIWWRVSEGSILSKHLWNPYHLMGNGLKFRYLPTWNEAILNQPIENSSISVSSIFCTTLKCQLMSQTIHGTGIYPYIYHKNQPNVGKYTIHGWYGCCQGTYQTTFEKQLRSTWRHRHGRGRWGWTQAGSFGIIPWIIHPGKLKNQLFEKENHLPNLHFWVQHVNFQSCIVGECHGDNWAALSQNRSEECSSCTYALKHVSLLRELLGFWI